MVPLHSVKLVSLFSRQLGLAKWLIILTSHRYATARQQPLSAIAQFQ